MSPYYELYRVNLNQYFFYSLLKLYLVKKKKPEYIVQRLFQNKIQINNKIN